MTERRLLVLALLWIAGTIPNLLADSPTILLKLLPTTMPVFPPIAEAIDGLEATTISLDGEWQAAAPLAASPEKFDASASRSVSVPGQWLQQGLIKDKEDGASVRRSFEVPKAWRGQNIRLRFESIHGNCRYWVNGTLVGKSTRLYTPVDLDITDAVKFGEPSELHIAMELDSAAETLSHTSEYAKHSLLGIDRSVKLIALPKAHIESLHLWSEHSQDYRDATLRASIRVSEATPEGATLQIGLTDPDGRPVTLPTASFQLNDLPKTQGDRLPLSLPVENPQLWTAETPHLYTLNLTLENTVAQKVEISRRVGLREIRVAGTDFLVNGKPIKLRGINRHEIDPMTGRADTVKWARSDAEIFKGASINYIRTSHYPPTREFMEACDEIGLYVQVEAPFCWTRGKGEGDPAMLPVWADATTAMVEYYRNSPSNIMWSLANESNPNPKNGRGLKSNYVELAEWYAEADPERPTTINNEWNNNGGLTDIANIHYPPPLFEDNPDIKGETRPVLIDEHWHMNCYNIDELLHDPGVAEEWAELKLSFGHSYPQDPWSRASWINRMEKSELFLGGAIWGGIDEIYVMPDDQESVGYGAWGIVDGWRRKKPEWWHTRMIYSPVWVVERTAQVVNGEAVIEVENRFHHTSLDALEVRAWIADGQPKTYPLPALAPGSSGKLNIPLPNSAGKGDTLLLDFIATDGQSVATWGVYLYAEPEPQPLFEATSGSPEVTETATGWSIQTANTLFEIDRTTSRLSGGPFRDRPYPHFTQKELKNWFVPNEPAYLQLPELKQVKVEAVTVESMPDHVLIRIQDRYPEFKGALTIRIDQSDTVIVESDYKFVGDQARGLREAGIRLPLQPGFETIDWSRRGYWNYYPEDHLGRLTGRARAINLASDNLKMSAKYDVPQEKPTEAWTQDPSRFGTRDFRASKLNFDWAALRSDSQAVGFRSGFQHHIRPALVEGGIDVFINKDQPGTTLEPGKTYRASVGFKLEK